MPTLNDYQKHREQIRRGLLSHSSVEECAVLSRRTADGGEEWAAYVVVSGPFLPERLHTYLQTQDLPSPAVFVPIAALPLTTDGETDEAALKAIPVLDSRLLADCEAAMTTFPDIALAAAVTGEYAERLPALHLSDLIPGWKAGDAAAPPDMPDALELTLPTKKTDKLATGRLSLSEGVPIRLADDEPATLPDALRRTVAKFGEQRIVYVQADGSEIEQRYAALQDDAERILAGLRGLGLRPGDKVLFQLDHNQDFIPGFWGCVLGGFVPVPISIAPTYEQTNANTAKLHNAWLMLDKPVILAGENLSSRVRSLTGLLEIPEEEWRVVSIDRMRENEQDTHWHVSAPDDVAIMLLTSGSTGKPKGVVQRHSSLLLRSAATVQDNGFDTNEVSLNWFPMDHVGGIVMFHVRDVYLGGRQVHAPTNYVVREPLKWLDLIEKHRITNTWAPNFAYGLVNARAEEVAKGSWDLSSLRFILNAGEAIVSKTARRFVEILAPHGLPGTAMRPAWGMSETCSAVTYAHDFTLDSTSDSDSFVVVGTPIPGFAMRIADANGNLVEEGVIGRLEVRGPSVTTGYYKNDEVNRESFTPDGWFNTGDLAILRNGAMSITGRQKDVIIINGVNFYSHEIEAVAEEVDGVDVSFTAACAVRPGGKDTDDVCIFFHSPLFTAERESAGTNEERIALLREIRGAVVRNVGINPTYLVPVEKSAVPKTEIGKIQRAQLRQRFESGEFDANLKALDILTSGANTVPNWFFRTIWRAKAMSAPSFMEGGETRQDVGVSLLFADKDALSDSLADGLSAFGPVVKIFASDQFEIIDEATYRLNPGNATHYDRLFAELSGFPPVRRVAHGWTYGVPTDGEIPSATALEAGQERGVYSLLALIQALTRVQGTETPVRVQVVSSHTQIVLPDDEIAFDRTPILGLIKTISQELPQIDIQHIDLAPEETSANRDFILAELSHPIHSALDRETAYRNGQRFIARLEQAPLNEATPSESPFNLGGLVLVAGGLGGVGAEVAARLLKSYRSRVLLLGRTPLPGRETWEATLHDEGRDAERIRAFQRLEELAEAGGAVRYIAADVADLSEIRAAVRQTCSDWDCRLEAALHLAGGYHDRVLMEETAESFRAILRPKVAGSWAIHQVLQEYPGSVFVGFSSAVASFGGAMIGAYVTANRFLTSFSEFQRRQGVPSYAFEWSTWDGMGMSRGYGGKDPLRARGFMDMSASQGIDSLFAALHREPANLLIGLDGANAFIRRHSEPRGNSSVLMQQATLYASRADGATAADFPPHMEVTDRYGLTLRVPVRRLATMPLTETGEIDRDALADLGRRTAGGTRRVAPRTETEQKVLALWQEALGVSAIGIFDSFFELGGHSLLATQVIARIRDVFGVELPLQRLFEAPTIAGLSEWLDGEGAATDAPERLPIERVSRDEELPLSFTQRRLWFIDQLEPGNPVYNISTAFRLRGKLNVAALERAINEIVRRHEALRTLFPAADGVPSQRILPELTIDLPTINLSGLAPEERRAEASRLIVEMARTPFDFANGPLLRAALLNLGGDEWILLVNTHHIISDGWSLAVFNRELSALYDAFLSDAPSPLPELPIQYADYAVWQRRTWQGAEMERLTAYWKRQLSGAATTLNLVTDNPRPPVQSYRGAKIFYSLPLELAETARNVSQQYGVTLYMTLLAAFQTTLRRLTHQDDIIVGSPIAGRTHTETEPLIGFLANTLTLRTQFSGAPTFIDLLTRVREAAVGAYGHQEMPFEKLVEIVRPPRDPSRNPLFQANFRLQTIPPAPLELCGVNVEPIEVDAGVSRFDVATELWSYPESFGGYFEYSTDLFTESSAKRMISLFEETLTALVSAPDQPIDALFASKTSAPNANGASGAESGRAKSLRESRRKAVTIG